MAVGAQDPVLSLISGGFDSTVSTYLCIKRGLRAHYCFFNLGGRAHEIGVKEVAYYLWNKYGSSHRVKFVTVPFEDVLGEILDKVDNSYITYSYDATIFSPEGKKIGSFKDIKIKCTLN